MGKGSPVPKMVGAHEAEIKGVQFFRRPRDILHGADAGGGAINGNAVLDRLFQHRTGGAHAGQTFGIGGHLHGALTDPDQFGKTERLAGQLNDGMRICGVLGRTLFFGILHVMHAVGSCHPVSPCADSI